MHTEPMEYFDIPDGATWEFRVDRYDYEPGIIHTDEMPRGKEANILRVHVAPAFKAHFPYYWDITSKRLIAQLLPHLEVGSYQTKLFRVTAHGVKPQKWFTLEVIQP